MDIFKVTGILTRYEFIGRVFFFFILTGLSLFTFLLLIGVDFTTLFNTGEYYIASSKMGFQIFLPIILLLMGVTILITSTYRRLKSINERRGVFLFAVSITIALILLMLNQSIFFWYLLCLVLLLCVVREKKSLPD